MIKVILDSQMCCRSKKDLLHQKNSILVYNPFVEDITDWKEKGSTFWEKQEYYSIQYLQ